MKTQKLIVSLRAPQKLAYRNSGNQKSQRYRTKFMRDRDRILYSKAFRRLGGKTQVFKSDIDDHFRNRLTHTLEVSQIATTIATNLNLDAALTEAIALGHDLGHTPFGHAGERILNDILQESDPQHSLIDRSPMERPEIGSYENIFGFKHNWQSTRIATELEWLYGEAGLDLTNFTLYGITCHSSKKWKDDNMSLSFYKKYDSFIQFSNKMPSWSFEAFIVGIADEIAQRHHDIEDALEGKLMLPTEACDFIYETLHPFFKIDDKKNFSQMKRNRTSPSFSSYLSRFVVNMLTHKIILSSIANLSDLIQAHGLKQDNFADFMLNANEDTMKRLIQYDIQNEDQFYKAEKIFGETIRGKVLSSYEVQRMDAKGEYIIRRIVNALFSKPEQLSDNTINRFMTTYYHDKWLSLKGKGIGTIRTEFMKLCKDREIGNNTFDISLLRTVCDHVAGMTDRYAMQEYNNLYGIN